MVKNALASTPIMRLITSRLTVFLANFGFIVADFRF